MDKFNGNIAFTGVRGYVPQGVGIGFLSSSYFQDMLAGEAPLQDMVAQIQSVCHNAQIILAGYSQGAYIVHRYLDGLDSTGGAFKVPIAAIAATLLLADPAANAGPVDQSGNSLVGNGIPVTGNSSSGILNLVTVSADSGSFAPLINDTKTAFNTLTSLVCTVAGVDPSLCSSTSNTKDVINSLALNLGDSLGILSGLPDPTGVNFNYFEGVGDLVALGKDTIMTALQSSVDPLKLVAIPVIGVVVGAVDLALSATTIINDWATVCNGLTVHTSYGKPNSTTYLAMAGWVYSVVNL